MQYVKYLLFVDNITFSHTGTYMQTASHNGVQLRKQTISNNVIICAILNCCLLCNPSKITRSSRLKSTMDVNKFNVQFVILSNIFCDDKDKLFLIIVNCSSCLAMMSTANKTPPQVSDGPVQVIPNLGDHSY